MKSSGSNQVVALNVKKTDLGDIQKIEATEVRDVNWESKRYPLARQEREAFSVWKNDELILDMCYIFVLC